MTTKEIETNPLIARYYPPVAKQSGPWPKTSALIMTFAIGCIIAATCVGSGGVGLVGVFGVILALSLMKSSQTSRTSIDYAHSQTHSCPSKLKHHLLQQQKNEAPGLNFRG